jgi:hypothetical protein
VFPGIPELFPECPLRRSAGRAFALVHREILMQTLLLRCLRERYLGTRAFKPSSLHWAGNAKASAYVSCC